MTRPLRRAHLWIWVGLSIVLTLLTVAAIVKRPALPVNPSFRWSEFP